MLKEVGIVYAIINKVTDKIYFGETKRNGKKRLNEHRLALNNMRERNKQLQSDYSELGEENFTFEVIIETSEHKLCELVLVELFSRIEIGYKQRRGDRIQSVIKGDTIIPKEVYQLIEDYINQKHKPTSYFQVILDELQNIESGFECKSKEIYNRDFKNQFLTRYAHSTRRVVEVLFRKISKYEKQSNKDLYDFTIEEAEEVLYFLKAKTLRSIQNHNSKLHNYLKFAMEQGVSKNEENYYNKLNGRKYLLF